MNCVQVVPTERTQYDQTELNQINQNPNQILPQHQRPYQRGTKLKFMFSKKATKINEIFTVDLTLCSKCQIDSEDFINFCGLLIENMNFTVV